MTYVAFKKVYDTGKTTVHAVYNSNDGSYLGHIKWHGGWRKYVLSSAIIKIKDSGKGVHTIPQAIPTIWSADCLKDVAQYIDLLMEERRLLAAARRESQV